MKISAIGTTILLLACVTCNYGQIDMEKGLGMIKKAMSCFGNVDLTKMMQSKGDNMNPGKLIKAFQTCKSQPMDQMVMCVGRETGVNSTVLSCLSGVMSSSSTQ
ncbi:uncharacterized protein LOC119445792 isoform X1 [Dermacentor silvarum]|uniref:uncharacterized protein LOC119445792 isoform X1 n=1 Tax=Dermacentor silvarum TaxID=543639 RepID=UPI00189B4D55|nr:uncharacterized protein LOC119445792 isoform X1 [Dermacentor silvarum]